MRSIFTAIALVGSLSFSNSSKANHQANPQTSHNRSSHSIASSSQAKVLSPSQPSHNFLVNSSIKPYSCVKASPNLDQRQIDIKLPPILQEYWQQEVHYTIQVKLDDINHQLHGNCQFKYINHSPQPITQIPIHLWANGYKNSKTALAKQLAKNGKNYLNGETQENLGYIDSINFISPINKHGVIRFYANDEIQDKMLRNQPLQWSYHKEHQDIAYVQLPEPLMPGDSITIGTTFKVQIPNARVSRLGHIGQAYQITQWYPKPAVFDKNGWHEMPYLNQGEFYSEYGTFDVKITLPDNYTVGATGDLQTESEIARMDYLSATTPVKPIIKRLGGKGKSNFLTLKDTTPASSKKWKTLHYTQSNVHDFAWFADKSFIVNKGSVKLPHSNRTVTTWTLYTPANADKWQYAQEYIQDGTYYYSLWNGDYPYNQVTAVDGTISAGGGMEYPNVTVIGNVSNDMQLEVVIVHEVGHNWFYGILGSNERDNGWMDEGLNTLNEMRYMETKYPNNKYLYSTLGMTEKSKAKFHLEDFSHHDEGDIAYRFFASNGLDQPICTHSADFTQTNYGIVMYQKTGLVFTMLKSYLGDKLFDSIFHGYFNQWKFKHPQPEDLRDISQKISEKDLSWLFNDLIQTTKYIDYKIKSVQTFNESKIDYQVLLKNKGQITAPMPVALYSNDSLLAIDWALPTSKNISLVQFKLDNKYNGMEVTKVLIDPFHRVPEIHRHNNLYKNRLLLPNARSPKFEFISGNQEPGKSNIFLLPALGWNSQDRTMLGITMHNQGSPLKKTSFFLSPMYSTGSNAVVGSGLIYRNWHPQQRFSTINFGIWLHSYTLNNTLNKSRSDKSEKDLLKENSLFVSSGELIPSMPNNRFVLINPYLKFTLGNRNKPKSDYAQTIELQGLVRTDNQKVILPPYIGAIPSPSTEVTFDMNTISTWGGRLQYSVSKKTNKWNWAFMAKHNYLVQSINFVDTPMWSYNNFRNPKNQKTTSAQQSEIAWKASYTYTKKRKISMRVYAGNVWGIKHSISPDKTGENIDGVSSLSLSLTGTPGTRDYFNDEIFLNRSGDASNSQTWSQQRGNNQGGFRNLSGTGLNSKQVFTGNFYIPFPIGPSFLGVFGDVGYFTAFNPTTGANNLSVAEGQFAWSSGIGVKFSDMFGLYLPVVQSQNLLDNSPSTWNQRIRINASFSFRLEPLSKAGL